MSQFACGYCGTQQFVERKGGTVALKPITDAIAKVQFGTDRTAAELALNRLPRELQALVWQRSQRAHYWQNKIANRRGSASGNQVIILLLLFFVLATLPTLALYAAVPNVTGAVFGMLIGIILTVAVFIPLRRRISRYRDSDLQRINEQLSIDLAALDLQIKDLSERIERNRGIANL